MEKEAGVGDGDEWEIWRVVWRVVFGCLNRSPVGLCCMLVDGGGVVAESFCFFLSLRRCGMGILGMVMSNDWPRRLSIDSLAWASEHAR